MQKRMIYAAFAAALSVSVGSQAGTPLQDSVPVLSSRPGAAYTVYLDPSGFAFDGMWLGDTPGNNLGFRNAGPAETFTAGDKDAIRAMWAATANQYRSFDVNVTTVDPAVAAGQAATDAQRQSYYDTQARMMHTVIGPPGNAGWQGSADGLAQLGVIDSVATNNGAHTNFMFSQDVNNGNDVADGNYIGSISSHEGGHTFGLQHQGDFTAGVKTNEYSNGDAAAGSGSYVPVMGNASDRQRATWRVGSATNDANVTFQQNDLAVITGNSGMTVVGSGIGNSFANATQLPVLTGGAVDVNDPLHRGIISPIDLGGGSYVPLGIDNYTKDYFKFDADGTSAISLTLNFGNDLLTPGAADNGLTLRGLMNIYDSSFSLVGSGVEDGTTLFTQYLNTLAAGSYFAEITSYGGHAEMTAGFDAASYFDMGGYFITGSGLALIPEPTTGGFILVSFAVVMRRRRAA